VKHVSRIIYHIHIIFQAEALKLLGVIPLGALIVYMVLLLLVRRSPHPARRISLATVASLRDRLWNIALSAGQIAVTLANARLLDETRQQSLENARLLEAERAARQVAETLQDLARLLGSRRDLHQLLELVLERLEKVVTCDQAVLFILEEDELCIAAERGVPATERHRQSRFPVKVDSFMGEVLQQSKPTLLADLHKESDSNAVPAVEWARSWIGAPLYARGEVMGLLTVAHHQADFYQPRDVQVVSAFADQVAVAIQNSRLYNGLREERERYRVLFERAESQVAFLQRVLAIGDQMRVVLNLPQVLTQICEGIRDILGWNTVVLFLQNESSGRTELVAQVGRAAELQQQVQSCDSQGLHGTWYAQEQFRISHSYLVDRYLGPEPANGLHRLASPERAANGPIWNPADCLVIPIDAGGKQLGSIWVDDPVDRQRPSLDQVQALEIFANQAAIAIENARLLEAEREQRELAEALRQVGIALSATLDFDRVLDCLLDQIARVVPYDAANVMLVEDGHIRIVRARGYEQFGPDVVSDLATVSFDIATVANLRWMVENRQPLIIPDTVAYPGWVKVKASAHVRSWAGAPIVVQGQVVAFFSLDKVEPGFYRPEHADRLAAFAAQAALALQNARLFSELERLYHETAEAHRRAETVLAEAAAGLMVLDPELRVSAVNPGAQTLFGRTADSLLGCSILELTGDSLWGPGSPLQRAIDSGSRVAPQTVTLATPDAVHDVLVGVTPIPDGYLLSFADVTQLKEVDRLKTEFVANVSHELRTPLASIKAYVELLLNGLDEGDAALRQHFLTVIDQETDRLSILVSDLLDLSRLESGRVRINKIPLDLRDMVRDVVRSIEIQAQEREIGLKVLLPDHLPMIMADPEMMKMVLKNLLSNAIKFSPPHTNITISCQEADNCVEMRVCDQGIGIPEEAMPHLFEKFYRVQSTTESGIPGSGLGLALVQEAVASHGGWVNVQSQVGKGSCFTVALPVTPAAELSWVMQTRPPQDSNQDEGDNGGLRYEVEITDC